MSDHDLDLITELINGRLSPDERRAALARVAADPELQSEYETQLAVSSLLRDAPPATMTAAERSDLRAALRQQLNLQDASTPVGVAPSRWQRWWAPVAGLAAAAAVIVGVVIVLPDGGSDDSLEFAAAQVETTVEASLSEEADVGGSEDSANDAEGSGSPTDTPGGTAEGLSTTSLAGSEEAAPSVAADDATDGTFEAAEEAPPEAAAEAPPEPLPHIPEVDLDELGSAYAEGQDEFESELRTSSAVSAPRAAIDAGACLGAIGDGTDESVVTNVATGTIEGIDVIIEVVEPRNAEPYLIALDARTCEELASTRS
jgi:hypothetical protein